MRKAKGITACQLAKEVGVSERSIRRWDKDLDEILFKHVVKMTETLVVELEKFKGEVIADECFL